MAFNKRILLLACPIFTVIAICIASVGYSSFKSLPSLQKFIQNVHITQQLKSKSRDLQFLDFSLEAGYQESFKQIYALKAYYNAILENKVDSKTSSTPTASTSNFVNLLDLKQSSFAINYPSIYSKINNLALKEMLQVTGWSSNDSTLTLTSALSGISSVYNNIEHDILQFSVLMKGILAPYYLQDQSSSASASFDLIYTLGITFPEEGFSVFMPLPTDSMLKTTGTLSTIPSAECTSTISGDENFENVCSTSEASLYIIKDQYNSYTNAGGISQKFKITTSTSATPLNAIISAEFSLSSQQTALSKSLINDKEGSLFITLDNEQITLLSFNSSFSNTTADTAAFSPLLLDQIFKNSSSSSTDAQDFKKLFNTARETIATQKSINPKLKYSDGPIKFEYYNNLKKNYCILSPIEVFVGDLDANDQLEIVDAQILFYLGYIVSEQDLINGFSDTNDRLKYIELVSFVVISVVSLFTICIVARYTYMISYSFQNPIITMSKLMQEIDPEHVDQEDQYEQYQNYFTSDEIKSLFEAMVTLLKNFKYSNQRFHDDDALTLLELSRAKQFYTKFGNQNGVGICCNNIGNIHLKNSRYLEAISEYQEAILMATMEYNITIDEMKKEKIDYEFKQQLQISDQFNLANPNSPLSKPPKSPEKRKKTYIGTPNINGMPSSPLKKPPQSGMYSSQNSSVKPSGVNYTTNNNLVSNVNSTYKLSRDGGGGGSAPRAGHFAYGQTNNINEDDIWEGDVEQSQTVRMHEQMQIQQQQETNNINDLSLQEKKVKDLLMKYDLSKTRLLNRKYQLGVALLEYSTQQKDELFHEAIRVFEKCILISDSEHQSLTNLKRKILILTKKIYCHLRLGEYKQAQAHIADARLMQDQLPRMVDEQSADEENTSLFLNIFASIPQEILKSKIDLQEAILELSRFNFRKSAELLTEIVECGVSYDSQIRKFAILCLKNIMEQFRLDVPELIPKLMKFNLRTIELIMLIDYSKDMTLDQIKQSHIRCKSIFDRISPTDKIGFAQFNDLVHENFPLQQKELYNDLLEKKIRSIPMSAGGRSNLFKALEVTTGLFDRKQQVSEVDDRKDSMTLQTSKNNQTYVQIAQIAQNQNKQQQQQSIQQSERLRFICLFTEGNNPISEQDLAVIKDQMQKKQVNLLIINICRQNANMLYLRFLATAISELGQFFMKGQDDVEEYLNKQREKPIKRQLIAEYF